MPLAPEERGRPIIRGIVVGFGRGRSPGVERMAFCDRDRRRLRVTPCAIERLESRTVCAVVVGLANDTGASRTDRLTYDPTVQLDRTLSAGQRLEYVVDKGAIQTAAMVDGRTFVPQGVGADGRHRIYARIVEADGRPQRWSRAFFFTLDRAVAPLTVRLSQDTGVSATDGVTSSSSLAVTGRDRAASVQYSRDTGGWDPATAVWGDYQPQPGANRWLVRQVDTAGNASAPVAVSFDWDTIRDTATGLEGPQAASFTAVAGQEVRWVIEFAAPLYVTAVNGTLPQVQFTFRGTTLLAQYREGSGTSRLTYSHVFTADEAGTGELSAPAKACLCYGGLVTDAAGNKLPKHALPATTLPSLD
jgi:hypothetical protein